MTSTILKTARRTLPFAAVFAFSLPSPAAPVKLFEEKPVAIKQLAGGATLVDFDQGDDICRGLRRW